MPAQRTLPTLYLLNATILLTHQIDAAYWQEWILFRIPGGIQVFLLLNLPIVFLVLYGYQQLISEQNSGLLFSWGLVASGLFAFGFHIVHLFAGDEMFRLPTSIGILIATLILSGFQGWWTYRVHLELRK